MPYIYQEGADHCFLVGTTRARCVVWSKAGLADKMSPYKDPVNNLESVVFCSDFSYYAKAPGFPVDVAVTHAAVTADGGTVIGAGFTVTSYTSVTETDTKLADHNLGYLPSFMVSLNGIEYPSGCPIQSNGSGSRRCVTFYADTTSIYVHDNSRPSSVGLPSIAVTYHVTVFRSPDPVAGVPLYQASATRVRLGYGKVDSNDTVIRDPQVGEPFYTIPASSVCDISNGRPFWVLTDGTRFDLTGLLFSTGGYNGTLKGVARKQVAIP